jgi:RHS repeat-associated protein
LGNPGLFDAGSCSHAYYLYIYVHMSAIYLNHKVPHSTIDYYPFGMEMPNRIKGDTSYRFGFNGQMQDNEFAGKDGAHLNFGERIFDSRIAKWLSLDPLQSQYPDLSPYNFCANNPLLFIDIDGREIWIVFQSSDGAAGKPAIKKVKYLNGKLYNEDGTDYKGNSEFVAEAYVALEYEKNNSSLAGSVINIMENCPENFTIDQSNKLNGSYDTRTVGNNNSITWNPFMGLSTGYKGRRGLLSPATILLHELIHGYIERILKLNFLEDDAQNQDYPEDEYLVKKYERVISEQLRVSGFNEGYRHEYSDWYKTHKVMNSTSYESNRAVNNDAKKIRKSKQKEKGEPTQSKNTRNL